MTVSGLLESGESQGKYTPSTGRSIYPHPPSVHLGYFASDRQAQPSARGAVVAVNAAAVELLKDAFASLHPHARAGVADCDLAFVPRSKCAYLHLRTRRRVLVCVR